MRNSCSIVTPASRVSCQSVDTANSSPSQRSLLRAFRMQMPVFTVSLDLHLHQFLSYSRSRQVHRECNGGPIIARDKRCRDSLPTPSPNPPRDVAMPMPIPELRTLIPARASPSVELLLSTKWIRYVPQGRKAGTAGFRA